jgi:Tfp pilus assembly PilM family ATPase
MTRRTSTFRQTDVARAVKAAQAAGLTVGTVEVTSDGTIRVITAKAPELPPENPFDQWRAKHARQTQGH